MDNPEKFGEEYRKHIRFVPNPLENTEAAMQTVWKFFEQCKFGYESNKVRYDDLRQAIEGLETTLKNLQNPTFWQWLTTKRDSAYITKLETAMSEIQPQMSVVERDLEQLKKEFENASVVLANAEAEWKKTLNS